MQEGFVTTFQSLSLALPLFLILHNCQATQQRVLAQEEQQKVLAHISYRTTYVTKITDDYAPRICFELYTSGRYRISRHKKGVTENLGGTLSITELNDIVKMLQNLDFESTESAVVRKGSELLIADVIRDGVLKRYSWLDPDRERPFPESANTIINWLQDFKAQGASPVIIRGMDTDPVCPVT